MAKIPLNKFRNRLITVPTALTFVYAVPELRATIIINAQATNTTAEEKRISLYIRNENSIDIPLVKDFPIPGYDSRSLIAGRVVLEGVDGAGDIDPSTLLADRLYVEASEDGLALSVSLLETVNKT
jgi:hypothetical protein